jgi:tetratricopeptide (TPR) repeat protein
MLKIAPEAGHGLLLRVMSLLGLGRFEQASREAQRMADANLSQYALLARLYVYLHSGNMEKALQECNLLIQRDASTVAGFEAKCWYSLLHLFRNNKKASKYLTEV